MQNFFYFFILFFIFYFFNHFILFFSFKPKMRDSIGNIAVTIAANRTFANYASPASSPGHPTSAPTYTHCAHHPSQRPPRRVTYQPMRYK
ncbi:hypothetical protein BDZ91DRAFT_48083 [Kalaharituber pfeilii]|nr:hypothetical protein BDZ91DRAFT_48083 [Kalaharituber pfeilii]